MKTKTKTRILAWIASVCMVAALIPAMPAEYASAATGATYVYNFVGMVDSDVTYYNPGAAGKSEFTANETLEYTKSKGSAPWQPYYANVGKDCKVALTAVNGIQTYTRNGRNAMIYLDIAVENSDWYTMQVEFNNSYGNDGSYHFSIYEGKQTDPLDGNALLFTNSFDNDKGTHTVDLNNASPVYLNSEKKYTVVIKAQGDSTSKGPFYTYSLTLTQQLPEIAATNAYPTAMQIGDTTKLDVTAVTLGDDNIDADVAVESSKEDVISVAEDGTLTALKAGTSTITVTATYNTDKTATEIYVITVREPEVSGTYVYYMTGQRADDKGILKDIIGSSFDTLSCSWKLESFTGGADEVRDSTFTNTNGVGILMRGNDKGTATLKIQAPAEGWYALSANVYESSDKATTAYSLVDAEGKTLASCDSIETKVNKDAKADNVVYLKANTDYDFVFYAETGSGASKQTSYLKNIKLTSIPVSEIFGDTYAYVKDEKVYFIGALKTIEGYSEVGFEVWVNGEQADDIHTDKVYKSFTVGEISKNAADFGAGDNGYIFITEKDVSSGDVIKIRPYISNGSVKTYHDEDFVLKYTNNI